MEAKRVLNFGKINYGGYRKTNLVTIDIKLEQKERGSFNFETMKYIKNPINLSISGNIWDSRKRYIVSGGQNLEEIKKYLSNDPFFMEIYNLWKKYHLNDLKAGTKKQIDFIKGLGTEYNYSIVENELEKAGLLVDNGYKYGSAWLLEVIPDSVITRIEEIIKTGK